MLYAERYHESLCCRDIYLKVGEEFFRSLEKEVISNIYRNNLKNRFLATSAWHQIFGLRSRLVHAQWSLAPGQKFAPLPRQIPGSSSCFGINAKENVLALGGGGLLDPENRATVSLLGKLIYLKIDKTTLKNRMFSAELPATFRAGRDPEEEFERIYHERTALYEKMNAVCIDLEAKSDREVLDILKSLFYECQ